VCAVARGANGEPPDPKGVEVPFFIRAETVDPVSGKHGPGAGAVNETATTKTEAIAKARSLKQRGYAVLVTDAYGMAVPQQEIGGDLTQTER